MVDNVMTIEECCRSLRLSANFASMALKLEGDSHQDFLQKLLNNEIEYRTVKRRSILLNTAGFPRRYASEEFRTEEIDFPDGVTLQSLLDLDFIQQAKT